MFLNIFKRKKPETFISTDNNGPMEEVNKKNSSTDIAFEQKIIYLFNGEENPFPEKCKVYSTTFEKEKYLSAAKEVYKSSFAGDIVEKIEITQLDGDAGHCETEIKNNNLYVTIRIEAFKLGLVEHSGYVHEYSDELCTTFTNILAHELVHAEDIKRTVDAFGIEEYQKIHNNKIAKLGWNTFSEYSACRKTAEQYGAFDSFEDVGQRIKNFYSSLEVTKISKDKELDNIMRLSYAIATRCAFADVSPVKEKDLYISQDVAKYKEYTQYILMVKKMLSTYYSDQPLNAARYEEFGYQILNGLSEIYKGKTI